MGAAMTTEYTVHYNGEQWPIPDAQMAECYSRAGAKVTAKTTGGE